MYTFFILGTIFLFVGSHVPSILTLLLGTKVGSNGHVLQPSCKLHSFLQLLSTKLQKKAKEELKRKTKICIGNEFFSFLFVKT